MEADHIRRWGRERKEGANGEGRSGDLDTYRGREASSGVGARQEFQVRLSPSLHLPKRPWPKKTESLPFILQTFISQKVEDNGGKDVPRNRRPLKFYPYLHPGPAQ